MGPRVCGVQAWGPKFNIDYNEESFDKILFVKNQI